MSNEKQQIEEMARIIGHCESTLHPDIECHNKATGCYCIENPCHNQRIADKLYTAGYRKQEWISVEDRLPEEGGTYLIVLKEKYEGEKEWRYHVDVASFTFDWDCIFHDWDEGQEIHITHWMPLPEAPKMKGGAK